VLTACWLLALGRILYLPATAEEPPINSIFFDKVIAPATAPESAASLNKSGVDFSDLIPAYRVSYWRLALAAVVPPGVLLVQGSSIAWILAGFRR